MKSHALRSLLALSLFAASGTPVFAQEDSVEMRLRDALKNTMLQLRDAQTKVATLQATEMQSQATIADLTTKLDNLTKRAAEDQTVSEKAISDLNARVADRDKEIGGLRVELAKWQQAQTKAAELARNTEAKRSKLEQENILLQRRVEDQHRKNMEMHRIGKEILERYEKFGLGDALLAREPFVGTTKVKFQNLIQDYTDELSDQRTQQ